ncbi:hypothetical protein PGB90_000672 [Kerria lacca]
MSVLPTLIVFDLDYTLWPFWVDTHFTPPFSKNQKLEKIVDYYKKDVPYYKSVPEILKKLKEDGIQIGVASRTSEIDGANQLLNLFDWNKYISYKEIYPGSKITHFQRIQNISKIKFKEMIFFDDEYRNIRDVQELGVLSILVKNGMNFEVLKSGLRQFESEHRSLSDVKKPEF